MRKETRNYKEIEFYRYPDSENVADSRYFRSRKAERIYGERYLHRLIYKEFYGSIPKGMHVHHVDGDCGNNDPSNLQCVTPAEHLSLHPEEWDGRADHMKKMQEMAKAWHASDEGIEWHRKHWNRSLAKSFQTRNYVCEQCGKEYSSSASTPSAMRFCSNKCKSAWRRQSGMDDEIRTCAQCGEEYTINKYRKNKYCSRECSNRSRVDSRVKL